MSNTNTITPTDENTRLLDDDLEYFTPKQTITPIPKKQLGGNSFYFYFLFYLFYLRFQQSYFPFVSQNLSYSVIYIPISTNSSMISASLAVTLEMSDFTAV